jgi:Ca2+-binding RTX toxin-like protein
MRAVKRNSWLTVAVVVALILTVLAVPAGEAEAGAVRCGGKVATIIGTSGDDVLRGTTGDDVIVALAGNDRVVAGSGHDTICGNAGDDVLVGGPGFDVMFGGYGADTVGYGSAGARVRVDLAAGTASGGDGIDEIFSIENVVGSRFDDLLIGTDGNNVMRGGEGHDRLKGRDGSDRLIGGIGRDELFGGAGRDVLEGVGANDYLNGGRGDDELRGGSGDDVLEPDRGDDVVKGGAGTNTLSYHAASRQVVVDLGVGSVTGQGRDQIKGVQNVVGSSFRDEIRGNGAGNVLDGGDGDDVIWGGAGTDTLRGAAGRDSLDGGAGPDFIDGGPDDDGCTNGRTYAACEPVPIGFVTREDWGARPPLSGSLVPHTIARLTVHHAGTQSATTGPARYRSWQAWHMDGKGWPDISYHFIVGVDGKIYEGRDPAYETDTFTDYDTTGHFQVVLEGNFDIDRPTAAQLESLPLVLAWAADEFGVSPRTIAGHGDHAHTACPGDHLAAYLDSGRVQDAVEALLAAGGVDLHPD